MTSSVENLTTDTQSKALGTGIASESGHWYYQDGRPCYEITGKNGKQRSPFLKEAIAMRLCPGTTTITGQTRKYGLELYGKKQTAMSALTMPRLKDETDEAFVNRIIVESAEHAGLAAERGNQLHKAIEDYIRGNITPEWKEHLILLDKTLQQHGINIMLGQPEHSFATQIDGNWYGGKIDYHVKRISDPVRPQDTWQDAIVLDFKSKDKIEPKKPLIYDEHAMQIAAYGYGLFGIVTTNRDWKWEAFRGINVFVGVNDCEIRVHEHTPEDLAHGFELFRSILDFWTRKHFFGKYSKNLK